MKITNPEYSFLSQLKSVLYGLKNEKTNPNRNHDRKTSIVFTLANDMQRANVKWSRSCQFSQIESNRVESMGNEIKVNMR